MRSTRSATALASLRRLYAEGSMPNCLCLHVVGADHREGCSLPQVQEVFQELIDGLYSDEAVSSLELMFVGPNMPGGLHGVQYTYYHECSSPTATIDNNPPHGTSPETLICDSRTTQGATEPQSPHPARMLVTVSFHVGLYHTLFPSGNPSPSPATPPPAPPPAPPPHVVFCFNAGLWGYDDWDPTIESLLLTPTGELAVVVTSYCSEEAEDDADMIQRAADRILLGGESSGGGGSGGAAAAGEGTGAGVRWLWGPECNPHRSLVERESVCAMRGRRLFENHSWQAFRPLAASQEVTGGVAVGLQEGRL
ncbi:unnamed protein product [Discosporangium mesarthrocarpum]